ncbi:MAG: hypothetical protein E7319_05985 [Clostridiales bacterium]|nr:hypothetical protein [Clostridiales bacterium]
MGMKKMPAIITLANGAKFWSETFENFKVKVYVPQGDPMAEIVNFGFKAPYLLIFEENEMTNDEAVAFADQRGFTQIAKEYSTSVVFVSPVCEGGWEAAPQDLFVDLIAESRIHQYFRDGVVTSRDRFTGQWGDCFIRGAIFRSYLYGCGKSADFIAKHYLKTIEGLYLWGPGEITPAVVTLENLSVIPAPERRDIPVVSVGNSEAINEALQAACDHVLVKEKSDVQEAFAQFVCRYKRWCGALEVELNMAELGIIEETGYEVVHTSADNLGDDQGTEEHKIGYLAYYNKGLLEKGKVPLVLAFHGGGDSSYHIAHVSGWYRVAHRHDFLLVAVENHLNSTATEMIEFIEKLKVKYPIDEHRIYASGFSMGGCKSWDLYQEYPQVFAALAPMDATFEVGLNIYGKPAPTEINRNTPVPLFYSGGEITPLPELPFQAEKCWDRMRYVFEVNRLKTPYNVTYDERETWPDPIWGISGDRVEKIDDPSRGSVLTLHYFESEDGVVRTVFTSVSGQGHDCREHTCEHAWLFMSQFTR